MDLPSASAPFSASHPIAGSSCRSIARFCTPAKTSHEREKSNDWGGRPCIFPAVTRVNPGLVGSSSRHRILSQISPCRSLQSPKKKTIAMRSVSHPRQPGFDPTERDGIPVRLIDPPAERDEPQIHGGIADPWNDDATQGESSQKIAMSGRQLDPFWLGSSRHHRWTVADLPSALAVTNHDSLTGQLPTLQRYSTALLRKAGSSPEPSSDERASSGLPAMRPAAGKLDRDMFLDRALTSSIIIKIIDTERRRLSSL